MRWNSQSLIQGMGCFLCTWYIQLNGGGWRHGFINILCQNLFPCIRLAFKDFLFVHDNVTHYIAWNTRIFYGRIWGLCHGMACSEPWSQPQRSYLGLNGAVSKGMDDPPTHNRYQLEKSQQQIQNNFLEIISSILIMVCKIISGHF